MHKVMLPALSDGLVGEVTLIRTKSFPDELRGIFPAVLGALLGAMLSSVGEVKCRLPFSTSRKVNTADLKSSQSPNVISKTCQSYFYFQIYKSKSVQIQIQTVYPNLNKSNLECHAKFLPA